MDFWRFFTLKEEQPLPIYFRTSLIYIAIFLKVLLTLKSCQTSLSLYFERLKLVLQGSLKVIKQGVGASHWSSSTVLCKSSPSVILMGTDIVSRDHSWRLKDCNTTLTRALQNKNFPSISETKIVKKGSFAL